jgi:hypothetical protein
MPLTQPLIDSGCILNDLGLLALSSVQSQA